MTNTTKRPRRPDVTPQELKLFYAACDIIRAEEPQMSVRGYAYRLGGMATYDPTGTFAIDGIRLHGEICVKEGPAPGLPPANEETIQRYLLYGRRTGRLPYDSVIDGTRKTISGGCGWTSRASAEQSWADARRRGIALYNLDIWSPQGKHVEVLSEKDALDPILARAARPFEVDVTSCKGFSSESLLYRLALDCVRRDVPTVYLVLVDLDRAGKNMVASLERNLRAIIAILLTLDEYEGYDDPDVTFKHIGLFEEQVAGTAEERAAWVAAGSPEDQEPGFPEVDLRPCKKTEKATWKNHTPLCAEVDFCSSIHIEEIVTDAIRAEMDPRIERARVRQERADQRWFRENG